MVSKVSPDRGLVFDGSFRFEQVANPAKPRKRGPEHARRKQPNSAN